jgi:hypothetical protein
LYSAQYWPSPRMGNKTSAMHTKQMQHRTAAKSREVLRENVSFQFLSLHHPKLRRSVGCLPKLQRSAGRRSCGIHTSASSGTATSISALRTTFVVVSIHSERQRCLDKKSICPRSCHLTWQFKTHCRYGLSKSGDIQIRGQSRPLTLQSAARPDRRLPPTRHPLRRIHV